MEWKICNYDALQWTRIFSAVVAVKLRGESVEDEHETVVEGVWGGESLNCFKGRLGITFYTLPMISWGRRNLFFWPLKMTQPVPVVE